MKAHIRPAIVAILSGLFLIVVYLVASSLTKTEKTGFIAAGIFSSIIVTALTSKFPQSRWYLAPIICLPLLFFLILIYKGDYFLYYLRSVFICILVSYAGTFTGIWISSGSGKRLVKTLKIWLYAIPVLMIVFLIIYSVKEDAKLNKSLVAVLDTIFFEDQKYRTLDKIPEEFNGDMKALLRKMNETDSINLIRVTDIIKMHGWPGEEIIGREGNSTIWAVIQHSSIEIQERYLPYMKEAVKNGNARPSQLALLEDRVLTNQGKEQIYGTQVRIDSLGRKEFYPIIDEKNVNKRRLHVGLGPLQWYAKSLGFRYRFPSLSR